MVRWDKLTRDAEKALETFRPNPWPLTLVMLPVFSSSARLHCEAINGAVATNLGPKKRPSTAYVNPNKTMVPAPMEQPPFENSGPTVASDFPHVTEEHGLPIEAS